MYFEQDYLKFKKKNEKNLCCCFNFLSSAELFDSGHSLIVKTEITAAPATCCIQFLLVYGWELVLKRGWKQG